MTIVVLALAVLQVLTGLMLTQEIIDRRRQAKRERRVLNLALELMNRRIGRLEDR